MLDSVLSVGGEWFLKSDLELLLVRGLHFDALITYNATMTVFLLYYVSHCYCMLVYCGREDSEAGCRKEPFKIRQLLKSKSCFC